jgi:hypothetical protein
MWNDAKFRSLSAPQPNAQSLWQRLLTGPELTNIPGVFMAWEAGLAQAMRWPLEGFRSAFAELHTQDMVEADWNVGFVYLPNAIEYNEPENTNIVLSWATAWEEMPECDLKERAHGDLWDWMNFKGEAWVDAFEKACGPRRRVRNPANHQSYPPANPPPKVTPNPPSNQEQEKEQEKKQDQNPPHPPSGGEVGSGPGLVLTPPPAEPAADSEEILRSIARGVFEDWKLDTGHHRSVLDRKRGRRIVARLREGFTREQLVTAIRNRRNDPFLMGQNDTGRVWDEIDTLLRDAAQVERLLALTEPMVPKKPANARQGPQQGPKQPNSGYKFNVVKG